MKVFSKILLSLLILFTLGFIQGRVLYSQPYYDDALGLLTQARAPAANYPGFIAFPAGSATSAYAFDDTQDECLENSIQLPHGYKEGTSLMCHVHWSPTTTGTGRAVWTIDYSYAGIGQVFTSSTSTFVQQAGSGSTNAHQVAGFPDITCTNCTISSIVHFKFCRDANGTYATDDYTGDAIASALDCHYQKDTPGSWTPSSK